MTNLLYALLFVLSIIQSIAFFKAITSREIMALKLSENSDRYVEHGAYNSTFRSILANKIKLKINKPSSEISGYTSNCYDDITLA
jgi:hypothetical protein